MAMGDITLEILNRPSNFLSNFFKGILVLIFLASSITSYFLAKEGASVHF